MRRAGPAEARGAHTPTRPFSDCDREQRVYELVQGAKRMRSDAQWQIEDLIQDLPAATKVELRRALTEWAEACILVGSVK